MLPCETGAATWERDGFTVSTDRARLDRDAIYRFLVADSYWAKGIDRAILERGIAGSLPFGLYAPDGAQAGFGRVITDGAGFAYLRDMFVLPAHRGHGLGLFLAECVCAHPDLATVHNWMLATDDAHGLYAKLGFVAVQPGRYMRRVIYRATSTDL
jgi:GNAT superfamily N-acetyltransferase